MKTYNIIFTFLLSTSLVTSATAQGVEKTLVKSFNLQGKELVELNLDGDVDVQKWDSPIMRIQMNLSVANTSESMLKSLIRAGRYNLKSKIVEDALAVYAPGLEREVRIKGHKLDEKISFVVFVPNDTQVVVSDGVSAEASVDDSSIK